MKNITKTIITAVVLLLTVGLFAQEDSIIVVRDEAGNALNERGQYLVPADKIVKDSKGNETVLDWQRDNTGLSIEEFVRHYTEYWQRVDEILKKHGETKFTVRAISLYDNKINLDKLEELKNNGFDVLEKIDLNKGLGYSFEGVGAIAEAVIIGEVVGYNKMSISTTGFYNNLKIRVDEVIKSSKYVNIGEYLECGQNYNDSGVESVPLNKKGIIILTRTADERKIKYYPIMLSKWWPINSDLIEGKSRWMGEKQTIPLDDFKKRVKELVRINNADNFYKRSWKEKQ